MYFSFKKIIQLGMLIVRKKIENTDEEQEETMSYNPSRCFSRDICLQSGITVFYIFQFHCNHLLISIIYIYCIICRA